ncbi:DUF5682 family protein [Spirochaeta cellobiosiphila]|uniref:DUF5682 family protein n=1 Tax=Spirochaeta cellobiosiphila TaxID=504483 RepID=UPI000402E0CC|nr:DUF5682 family protein [Spirochaeta cellobiosiphila]
MKDITFIPLRHHSPACALALHKLCASKKFSAILIEGPSDFNKRLWELYLPHELPLAIFSYFKTDDNQSLGAYYPFCEYSPEWQALLIAKQQQAHIQFIDLPWYDIYQLEKKAEEGNNLYNDSRLKSSQYIDLLCHKFGVNNFDDLWDELFESDIEIEPIDFFNRIDVFCQNARELSEVTSVDKERERFMAHKILSLRAEISGPILVLTGGYHSSALKIIVEEETPGTSITSKKGNIRTDTALIPYSYERLDKLKGYQSGMAGPGFYQDYWEQCFANKDYNHKKILMAIIEALRRQKQIASTADAIAAENACRILANLRGHKIVQRRDIYDGLKSVLIKDEISRSGYHPLLEVIEQVYRGDKRGVLAKGTPLPPLVKEIEQQLHQWELYPDQLKKEVTLNYNSQEDLRKSRLLHSLNLLNIKGFTKLQGPDFIEQTNLALMEERWLLVSTVNFHSDLIEASRFGGSLDEAIENYLSNAIEEENKASSLAILMIQVALALPEYKGRKLFGKLETAINGSSDFLDLAKALKHLLFLFLFDRHMNYRIDSQGNSQAGKLLYNSWDHLMSLLEITGVPQSNVTDYLNALDLMLQAYLRMPICPEYARQSFVDTLRIFAQQQGQLSILKGAVQGSLWYLDEINESDILLDLKFFSDPNNIGDYIEGLFVSARELVQRNMSFINTLDSYITGYSDEEFLEALPALKLAFTHFAPREKHYLAELLSHNVQELSLLMDHNIPEEVILSGKELDNKVSHLLTLYGIGD